MHLQAKNAHIGVHWRGEVLTLQPFTALLYQGEMQGILHGKQLSAEPNWDWDVHFNQIEVKPLLQDMNGQESKLTVSGLGEIALRASTSGINRKQLLSNLNGTSTFSVRNGTVTGLDLNYFIQTADAFLNSKPTEGLTNTSQTTFESLTGSAVIKNGIANTNDLFLSAPGFGAQATGVVDLANASLDCQLQVMPVSTGKIKWAVPLVITGDLNSPTIQLDKLKLETIVAKEQLDKVKQKVQDEVKQLPGKADKFFKKILGH